MNRTPQRRTVTGVPKKVASTREPRATEGHRLRRTQSKMGYSQNPSGIGVGISYDLELPKEDVDMLRSVQEVYRYVC